MRLAGAATPAGLFCWCWSFQLHLTLTDRAYLRLGRWVFATRPKGVRGEKYFIYPKPPRLE